MKKTLMLFITIFVAGFALTNCSKGFEAAISKRAGDAFAAAGFFDAGRVRGGVSKHETRCAKKESRQVRQPFIPILIQFDMRGLFMRKILYLKQINSVDM